MRRGEGKSLECNAGAREGEIEVGVTVGDAAERAEERRQPQMVLLLTADALRDC